MARLLPDFLTPEQVEASSATMGLDTTLIDDQTYFLIYSDGELAGCGGWSRRRTLYGGNHSAGRDNALADPAREPAKIRAMYTHPDFTRRGIGRYLIELGERAAKAEGFSQMELGATAAGVPLYERCGYVYTQDLTQPKNGVLVPVLRMQKAI